MSNGANVKCNHSTVPTHQQDSNVGMSNSAIIAVERPFKLRALIRSAEIIKGSLSSIIETFILNVSSRQCASWFTYETTPFLTHAPPHSRTPALCCGIYTYQHAEYIQASENALRIIAIHILMHHMSMDMGYGV